MGHDVGRYQDSSAGSTNHWALDGTYTAGKHTWTAEYTQSNRSNDNRAYAVTWEYGFDDKTAVYSTGFRVETNGDMGQQSDFDNNNRGLYYGIKHQLSKITLWSWFTKTKKRLIAGKKYQIRSYFYAELLTLAGKKPRLVGTSQRLLAF